MDDVHDMGQCHSGMRVSPLTADHLGPAEASGDRASLQVQSVLPAVVCTFVYPFYVL